jgi:hypothetical protein
MEILNCLSSSILNPIETAFSSATTTATNLYHVFFSSKYERIEDVPVYCEGLSSEVEIELMPERVQMVNAIRNHPMTFLDDLRDRNSFYYPDRVNIRAVLERYDVRCRPFAAVHCISHCEGFESPNLILFLSGYQGLTQSIERLTNPKIVAKRESGTLVVDSAADLATKVERIAQSMINRSIFSLILDSDATIFSKISMIFQAINGQQPATSLFEL